MPRKVIPVLVLRCTCILRIEMRNKRRGSTEGSRLGCPVVATSLDVTLLKRYWQGTCVVSISSECALTKGRTGLLVSYSPDIIILGLRTREMYHEVCCQRFTVFKSTNTLSVDGRV